MTQLQAMLLTWALELPIALFAARDRTWRLAIVVVLGTVVTHPFVWALGTSLPYAWWWPGIIAIEIVVGVVEGVFLWRFARLSRDEGLLIGIAMNAFSFGVGLLL